MVRTEAGGRASSDGVGLSWISIPDLFSRGPEISRSKTKLDLQLGVEASSRVVLQKGQGRSIKQFYPLFDLSLLTVKFLGFYVKP